MPEVSALGPIDPSSVIAAGTNESENKARGSCASSLSMTGRIVLSSYESLRAAGTTIICLSPWGDSSALVLPCIRFRDLAVHTVIAATGGMAAVASPVMGPVSDLVVSSFGDTLIVELGLHAGFEGTTKIANDLVIEKTVKHMIPTHSKRLETTNVKILTITLKFKQTTEDAALGFFRSSIHKDASLFSTVKDYLAVEKGWFSPYLFASARRPIIPRTMKPDILFCHGPFLEGDYKLGETLMNESASVIMLAQAPPPTEAKAPEESHRFDMSKLTSNLPSLSSMFARSPPSPNPDDTGHGEKDNKGGAEPVPRLTALPPPPAPRRMVILVVGLKPHRKLVIQYILLNGCPAIVVPVKLGAPLLAWDGLTLENLWKMELPDEGAGSKTGAFEGVVTVLFEFLDLCVDWARVTLDGELGTPVADEDAGKNLVKESLTLLVAAAIRSRESKEVRKELDEQRAGVAMWRSLEDFRAYGYFVVTV
ncbi:hypothetical protein BDZ89DRAFT_1066316 [Hymenopellis radicata]|nr:hypothetical protein BDZ89DRAFT_1066316 [Hymenopellis radicata]